MVMMAGDPFVTVSVIEPVSELPEDCEFAGCASDSDGLTRSLGMNRAPQADAGNPFRPSSFTW